MQYNYNVLEREENKNGDLEEEYKREFQISSDIKSEEMSEYEKII